MEEENNGKFRRISREVTTFRIILTLTKIWIPPSGRQRWWRWRKFGNHKTSEIDQTSQEEEEDYRQEACTPPLGSIREKSHKRSVGRSFVSSLYTEQFDIYHGLLPIPTWKPNLWPRPRSSGRGLDVTDNIACIYYQFIYRISRIVTGGAQRVVVLVTSLVEFQLE